jgi:hypothetical protein
VKKPTGVKIKSEVESPKPKVHNLFILNFLSTFTFEHLNLTCCSFCRVEKGMIALSLCPLLPRSRRRLLYWM